MTETARPVADRQRESLLEILDVTPARLDGGALQDGWLEAPRSGEGFDSFILGIAGTVLGEREAPNGVKITHGQQGLRRARTVPERGSRRARLEFSPGSQPYRFSTGIGVLGLPTEFEITVHAVFSSGKQAPIATIRGRHQPLRSGYGAVLQPLMVTSLARTGTTWLMRILGQHPAVIVHERYPYEVVAGRYWMHMLKVLSEPANHVQSTPVSHFEGDRFRIGHHPFFQDPFLDGPELRRWFERSYIERLAGFCQEMIDTYYQKLAARQGREQAAFFAEKHLPDHLQWMMWDLYAGSRELFLLRDPRDMLASMVAFNEKRGYQEFGREKADSDEEWVDHLRKGVGRLVSAWRARSGRAHLLRYEDLVTDPVATLSDAFEYLGHPVSAGSIEGLVARASAGAPELAGHRTSKTPQGSIGRWRHTLDGRWRTHVERAFGDLLGDLGYA